MNKHVRDVYLYMLHDRDYPKYSGLYHEVLWLMCRDAIVDLRILEL